MPIGPYTVTFGRAGFKKAARRLVLQM